MEAWKTICAGCRHINSQEPNQHCYMFRDEPSRSCAQHTETMEAAKKNGKLVNLDQLSEVVSDHLKNH